MKSWVRRQYQKVALVAARRTRVMMLFWARQCRKSTTLGDMAFDEMSKGPGKNVIAASASLLTGSELVSKTVSAAEQAMVCAREAAALHLTMLHNSGDGEGQSPESKGQSPKSEVRSSKAFSLKMANSETGKVYASLGADDLADLYRSSRLEMRLYHSRTGYSRLLIIAPQPATARGWSGKVFRDEAMFTRPELERELQVAMKPIIDTDPAFQLVYASNLGNDDRHPIWEMTLPEPGTEFPVNADGNFYRGQNGILIHRVALADAYAAGHVLYDSQEGKPLSYEEFCAAPENKLGLDESYRLIHKFGGSAAIDLFALLTSQRRGTGECGLFVVDSDRDFERGLAWLRAHLGSGVAGVGIDPATTTNATLNPTSVTVTERRPDGYWQVAVFVWKEKDPKKARERFGRVLRTAGERPAGRVRRCCMEATSEQYFARETAQELAGLAPWQLVDVRNKVEPAPHGYQRDPIYKTWLGDLYAAEVNDNHYALPPEEYLKNDHRMVIKSGGAYECEPEADGRHGDTFVSGMLAQHAVAGTGAAILSVEGIRMGGNAVGKAAFRPRALVRRVA